ncbi:unnamed protein product [Effrenium voratum]|uniref:Glycosyltransferase 2-like domain-containing protein n=1 Tax=Effrenium voratum TaxID=2562239 RepID=A0AA36J0S1_9DINO|nr:unnamed protein product [Effrenium voratum]CAJ1438623.1 unnamed protein product [Effrenium voratum]
MALVAAFLLQILPGLAMVSITKPDLHQWIPHLRPRTLHSGSLDQLMAQYRVVVVMTTIPSRIHRMEPVIDSMLKQTWPAAEIILSVPHMYNRTGETYEIPTWMREKPIRLVRCEDLGPGTHLLNGLRLERDPWTFLVVVDDDHIYGPELTEQLMRAAVGNPGSAVAAQGFLSVPELLDSPELRLLEERGFPPPRYLQDQGFSAGPVLVSYLGVVYQRGFFDDTVFEYSESCQQCRYQDDMWFSAHLAAKGIRRLMLGSALGVQELRDMHLGPESLTYWPENRPRTVSDDCNQGLLQANPGLWTFRRRVVLSLGGLPLEESEASRSERHVHSPLEKMVLFCQVSAAWQEVLASIKRLSRWPDLTYLCSPGWEKEGEGFVVGRSFILDGLRLTGSTACAEGEGRVSQLLRDTLLWEGDANTVLVLGSLSDLSDPEDVWAAADCAADMYDATVEEAENEEQALRDVGETALRQASTLERFGYPLLNSLFRQRVRSDPPRRAEGSRSWPYCRVGKWLAASVGAFSARG